MQQTNLNSFDPYGSSKGTAVEQVALLDTAQDVFHAESDHVLEMEEEDSVSVSEKQSSGSRSPYDPVATSSGLLLTHRRTSPATSNPTLFDYEIELDEKKKGRPSHSPTLPRTHLHRERFEVEYPWTTGNSDSVLSHIQKLFSYTRVWVVLSSLVLILGTAILFHHAREQNEEEASALQKDRSASSSSNVAILDKTPQNSIRVVQLEEMSPPNNIVPAADIAPDQIVFLPLDISKLNRESPLHRRLYQGWQRKLNALRSEFDSWIEKHDKRYNSREEREYRFNIWQDNHHRIMEKNERHGPCRMTNQKVFGSNHFQDLTKEEFENHFLNAKHIPVSRKLQERKLSSGTMGPHITPIRHPEVHQRYRKMVGQQEQKSSKRGKEEFNCHWLDISCCVRWFVRRYFYGFYGIGTTLEPAYDSDTYPKAVDWRDLGAVTNVRSQDNCGACWAITAVECVESANFITYGTLYDLSEYELILCVENSEKCYGGWPEDAFDYIIEHGGVALESDLPYDGDFLLSMTMAEAGESSEMSAEDVDDYVSSICPANSHDSRDNNNGNSNSLSRYGKIDGYGYATDKCVCYTDGSGCDCDTQNEGLAVANLATYGPAVVCVDASEWKDYAGGIITASSGCSSAFLDVNHCVQAVGYAFYDDDEDENGNSRSGSGSGSGSQDNAHRVGYWIVRNQWSEYWGMSGYGYVAMGDNTCGILNDMMQAYTQH